MLLKEQRESAVAPERHPRCNFPRYGQTPLLSRTKKTLRADTSSAPPLPTCYGCDMAHILQITRLCRVGAGNSEGDHRRRGGIPHGMCAEVSDPDYPGERHERDHHQQDGQPDADDCRLLGIAVFAA